MDITALLSNNTDVYMHFKTILPTAVVTIKMYSISDSLIVKCICLSYTHFWTIQHICHYLTTLISLTTEREAVRGVGLFCKTTHIIIV